MARKGAAKSTLTEEEMIRILEDIARNPSNAQARIAAIKMLREMNAGKNGAESKFGLD